MKNPLLSTVTLLALSAAVTSAQTAPKKVADILSSVDIVTVQYNPAKMIPIAVREGLGVMVTLPEQDGIMRIDSGSGKLTDGSSLWPLEYTKGQNFFSVRAALENEKTNLHVVTTSGRIYSFVLLETKAQPPNQRVNVVLGPEFEAEQAQAPKFYPAADVEALKAQLAKVESEARAAQGAADAAQQEKAEATAAAAAGATRDYPAQLRFYAVSPMPPFNVKSMWTDGKYTWIRTSAREIYTVLEIKDKKPAEVNFDVQEHGLYVMPKVLGDGRLKLGDKEIPFIAPAGLARGN